MASLLLHSTASEIVQKNAARLYWGSVIALRTKVVFLLLSLDTAAKPPMPMSGCSSAAVSCCLSAFLGGVTRDGLYLVYELLWCCVFIRNVLYL